MPEQFYCEKCNKTMAENQFYKSNNLEKYPAGKIPICKKCLTMHVDNFNPDTYLWILKECDVPYIPEEWDKLLASYGRDKSKLTGLTIIGRYLGKMALKQWKDYRWKDTDHLRQVANKRLEEAMKAQGYSAIEIDEAKEKANTPMNFLEDEENIKAPPPEAFKEEISAGSYFTNVSQPEDDDYFARQTQSIEDEAVGELTEEDKRYLCLKWGKTYKPEEWIRLEQLYTEMTNSYDIQAAGDLNTLKLVCKSSLKANQLMDIGDIEGAQKMAKVYESMMRSGKWTAAQIKETEENAIDSIGQIVAICERDGFIPRYYVDGPQDKPDKVLMDLQKYTHDLVVNESGLGIMIENAMKQMKEEEERIKAAAEAKEAGNEDADLFNYDDDIKLTTGDYQEFSEFEEELEEDNEDFFRSLEDD